MNTPAPRIIVTGSTRGSRTAWHLTRLLLRSHGLEAAFVHSGGWKPHERMDGLLLLGGVDVDPARYGRKRQGKRHRIEPERDAMEMALIDRALNAMVPVLGICRGMQLINIFFGGTLHQEVSAMELSRRHLRSVLPGKRIEILSGTRLRSILAIHAITVNALHHQAIDVPGEGLIVSAKDRNGLVQAIEHPGHAFLLGVQWHPEFMPYLWHTQRLFGGYAKAVKRRAGATG